MNEGGGRRRRGFDDDDEFVERHEKKRNKHRDRRRGRAKDLDANFEIEAGASSDPAHIENRLTGPREKAVKYASNSGDRVPSGPVGQTGSNMAGATAQRLTGTVKYFNSERGFGFIAPDDGGKDVFVHISAVERSGLEKIAEGARLSFLTEESPRGKGPQAVSLQAVE